MLPSSCGNAWLNVDVVRKHWNFSGVIETDCGAMNNPNMCGRDADCGDMRLGEWAPSVASLKSS
jgi:beta-glucosidase-like glycosyl hydrolase